jgi:hypothetical protein
MKETDTAFPDRPWPDPNHDENRAKVPWEELEKYRGRHVAWSWDGTHIVADAAELEELYDRLDALGVPSDRVVFSYIDDI